MRWSETFTLRRCGDHRLGVKCAKVIFEHAPVGNWCSIIDLATYFYFGYVMQVPTQLLLMNHLLNNNSLLQRIWPTPKIDSTRRTRFYWTAKHSGKLKPKTAVKCCSQCNAYKIFLQLSIQKEITVPYLRNSCQNYKTIQLTSRFMENRGT